MFPKSLEHGFFINRSHIKTGGIVNRIFRMLGIGLAFLVFQSCAVYQTMDVRKWLPICGDADSIRPEKSLKEKKYLKYFKIKSELLSAFWKEPVYIEAGVILPDFYKPGERLPVCIDIHGYKGSHRQAWAIYKWFKKREYPRMIYVFPNAMFQCKHHVFANSENSGPWAEAFVEEFIPALEEHFGAYGNPGGRFLTGHSSGGWSCLWLQISYPDFFGGVWSRAPDPVDFRNFSGINLYTSSNLYFDSHGNAFPFVRRDKKSLLTMPEYVRSEFQNCPGCGQMDSFEFVFSPKGAGGRPKKMFDRETGKIHKAITETWKNYDISLILRRNWEALGHKLKGKINIIVGEYDQFRLDGAVLVLQKELEELDAEAEISIIPGRGHMKLAWPHPQYYPMGYHKKMYQDMMRKFTDEMHPP